RAGGPGAGDLRPSPVAVRPDRRPASGDHASLQDGRSLSGVATSMSSVEGGPKRVVLVVDDDSAIRRVVRTVLEADNFEVVEAADGPAALLLLDAINGRGPEAVALDIMMPAIAGMEVWRRNDHSRVNVGVPPES